MLDLINFIDLITKFDGKCSAVIIDEFINYLGMDQDLIEQLLLDQSEIQETGGYGTEIQTLIEMTLFQLFRTL